MPLITFMGDGWFAILVIICCSFLPMNFQFQMLFTWVISFSMVLLLKYFFFDHLPRPATYFYDHPELLVTLKNMDIHVARSFPSGHSACAFAILGTLATIVDKKIIQIMFFFLAFLVAWSRIYLGQHFFEDVLFGGLLGMVSVFLGQLVFRGMQPKKSLIRCCMNLL